MSTYAPFAKPLYVMLKPVGAVCNLACDYCYYLEKSKLYRDNPKHVMSEELLEKFIEEYINSQTMPQVLFTWRWRRDADASALFLQTCHGAAKEICQRTHHRQLHTDQRHVADR